MDKETKREFENLAIMMKQGFDAVDERFEQVDKRFEQIDKRFEQVDKRFEQVDKRFEQVDEQLKELKEDFNKLLTAVDGYAKKADDYFQEMVMLSHKVDRHERWIQQIAEKLGIKLEY